MAFYTKSFGFNLRIQPSSKIVGDRSETNDPIALDIISGHYCPTLARWIKRQPA
jgi:hypothetical protein